MERIPVVAARTTLVCFLATSICRGAEPPRSSLRFSQGNQPGSLPPIRLPRIAYFVREIHKTASQKVMPDGVIVKQK